MNKFMTLMISLILVGCGGSNRPGGSSSGGDGFPDADKGIWNLSPSEIILYGASALAAAGFLCLIGAFVSFVFLKNRGLGITFLTCAAGAIIGAPILYWVGANLWWIALVAALAGLGIGFLLARKHIEKIEAFLGVDLNRDGKIGRKTKTK